MTKQLLMAALVLASVTVLSLGIRQVRFSLHQIRNAASAEPAALESQGAPGQSSINKRSGDNARAEPPPEAFAGQSSGPSASGTIPTESYPEETGISGREAWAEDDIEPRPDLGESADNGSLDKSPRQKYATTKGAKGLEKISLSDSENVYITEAGEHWYVRTQPDGTTTKMQLQVEDRDGEFVIVGTGEANVYRPGAGGSKGLQRISVGDNEDVYITEAGEHWYVSTLPDGTTTKMQFEVEDRDGDLVIVGTKEANVYQPE